jgi:hypothetical protein
VRFTCVRTRDNGTHAQTNREIGAEACPISLCHNMIDHVESDYRNIRQYRATKARSSSTVIHDKKGAPQPQSEVFSAHGPVGDRRPEAKLLAVIYKQLCGLTSTHSITNTISTYVRFYIQFHPSYPTTPLVQASPVAPEKKQPHTPSTFNS